MDERLFTKFTLDDGTTVPFPRLLTTAEVAAALKVKQRTVLQWIGAKTIPYLMLPSTGEKPSYRIPAHRLAESITAEGCDASEFLANRLENLGIIN